MKKTLLILLPLCTSAQLMAMDHAARKQIEKNNDFIAAVCDLNLKKVKQYITTKIDVNWPAGKSALMYLGEMNDYGPEVLEIAKTLLENQADPNLPNVHGDSALAYAAESENAPLCKLLINYGARVELQNKHLETALFKAGKRTIYMNENKTHLQDTIKVLLTTIPLSERELIRGSTIFLGLLKSKTTIPRDIRKLIAAHIINSLTQKQIDRIKTVLTIHNSRKKTAYKAAKYHDNPRIPALLNPETIQSNQKIRKEIANNFKRILFGKSIQERQKEQTHYALLGIGKDASPYEIEAAYRNLYLQMQEAFNTLRDPATRKAYDQELSKK